MNLIDYCVPAENIGTYLSLQNKKKALLLEKPWLQELQDRIDATLNAAGDNPIDRCTVLNHIMLQSLHNLGAKNEDLLQSVKELKENLDKFKEIDYDEIY